MEKEEIDRQLSLYLLDKRYNLDIVDVIPAVISNILDVTLKIINEQTNNTCDVIDVYPIQATNGVLAVHRFGDHYNGIVRARNSLPLHQRTTYTREELGQFNKSNLRLPRKLRKTLIKKKIWKPTRSTRVQKQRSCAKFALVNAQSVRNRTALLLSDYVMSNNIDIACITETWLTQLDNVDIAVLQGNNYTLSHVMRDNIRGGGVGVLFKSTYKLLRSTPISCEAYEGINITLKHPNSTLITVVVIYRSPSLSMGSFFERFNGVLQETFVHGNNVIICGDFNIHYNNTRCKCADELTNLIDQCGYKQLVTGPTHTRGNTLDLIITPSLSNIVASKPRTTILFSDHFVVECDLKLKTSRPPSRDITYRKFRDIDKDQFSLDLTTNLSCCDTVSDFNSNVLSVLNKHAPVRTRTVTDHNHQPCYNGEIAAARRELRRKERQGCKDFRIYRNKFCNLLHFTKHQFYKRSIQTITESKDNIKALYKITDSLIGKDQKLVLPSCASDIKLCEDFSNYFTDKVQQMHTQMDNSRPRSSALVPTPCTSAYLSSFPIVTNHDVGVLIKNMKPKACVLDPIPAYMFKEYVLQIAPPIRAIINTSLFTGTVPNKLKESVITPIYKRKQLPKDELSSYRPVAQMPIIAKLMETHVSRHLRGLLEDNGMNDPFQSAYRPYHSTETATVKIFSDICLSLSRSRDVVLCLLDLRSAFDTLQHEILIQRLADIGVRDKALEWFRSYLVDRTTSVKVNNSRSCCSLVKYGVPQGSVLGPTLFNVYCRPLGRIIRKNDISYHMYADDSQLYVDFSPCDEKTALANLQRCFVSLITLLICIIVCYNFSYLKDGMYYYLRNYFIVWPVSFHAF